MYVIYRGEKINILRQRDLDQELEFSRSLSEYLLDVRNTNDGLEARAIPSFKDIGYVKVAFSSKCKPTEFRPLVL